MLYDHAEGEDACDLLHWRREGEAWEPPADEAEEGEEAAPLSLGDIVQQISAAERWVEPRTVAGYCTSVCCCCSRTAPFGDVAKGALHSRPRLQGGESLLWLTLAGCTGAPYKPAMR